MSAPGRYARLAVRTHTTADGREVPYRARRFLPRPQDVPAERRHVVGHGDRPDVLAALLLGDPDQGWLIADANGVRSPRELEEVGRVLRIPVPGGLAGATDVR